MIIILIVYFAPDGMIGMARIASRHLTRREPPT
jgi:hypothetical protein